MGKNQKKRLQNWISNFIEVAIELSPGLRITVNCGNGELIAPVDVLEVLKKKGVVFQNNEQSFFEYQSEVGATLVRVIGNKDSRFSLSLTLQQSKA